MTDSLPYLVSLFIGIGLAAATGFRVFLPIFFLSLGTYLKIIPLDADYAWIGSLPAEGHPELLGGVGKRERETGKGKVESGGWGHS